MNEELRSYIEAAKAWLDGKPIQYCPYKTNYPDEADWEDWIGGPDDEPYYDGEFWRVKPGEYMWVRLYQGSDGKVGVTCAKAKEELSITFLGVTSWVSEPILVKINV